MCPFILASKFFLAGDHRERCCYFLSPLNMSSEVLVEQTPPPPPPTHRTFGWEAKMSLFWGYVFLIHMTYLDILKKQAPTSNLLKLNNTWEREKGQERNLGRGDTVLLAWYPILKLPPQGRLPLERVSPGRRVVPDSGAGVASQGSPIN